MTNSLLKLFYSLYSPICCAENNQYVLGESESSKQEIVLEVGELDGAVYGWSDSGKYLRTYLCSIRCNEYRL